MKKSQAPLTEGVYYILLALTETRHGYGIMQYVAEISNGRVELGAGTLYGAIKSLLEKKWIEAAEDDGRKKEYLITAEGRKVIQEEMKRLKELYQNGVEIMQGADDIAKS